MTRLTCRELTIAVAWMLLGATFDTSTGFFYSTNADGNTVVLKTNLGAAAGDIPTAQRPH